MRPLGGMWPKGGFLAANFALVPSLFPCMLPYMDTAPLTLIRPLDASDAQAAKRPQKRSHRATKLQLPSLASLDQRTNAAKQFQQIARDIESDLGGRDRLSTIERSLIDGFAGCSVALQALNVRLVRDGEQGLDLGLLALLGGALCRLATKLGTERRAKPVPSLAAYLEAKVEREEAS
jgi:hypothetical protein